MALILFIQSISKETERKHKFQGKRAINEDITNKYEGEHAIGDHALSNKHSTNTDGKHTIGDQATNTIESKTLNQLANEHATQHLNTGKATNKLSHIQLHAHFCSTNLCDYKTYNGINMEVYSAVLQSANH